MSTTSEIIAATHDVFISYSRADKSFVDKLVKQLERFSIPKALGLPSRRLRIFVDTKDLIGTSYYEAVEKALVESRKLIVVCSPSSRKSQYVEDEIKRFLRSGEKTGGDIIPVHLNGIPNNEARTPEDEALKAFPEALYDQMEMPLAVAYSGFDPRIHKLDKGGYMNSWYVLLANILEVERNDLEERDARRRRKRRAILSAITAGVIAVLTVTTIIALWQRHEAVEQRRRAYAQQLAAQAQFRMSKTAAKPHEGIKQAIASLQLASSQEAVEALKTGIFRLPPEHVSQLAIDDNDAKPAAFSPNGEWIVGSSHKGLTIWRSDSGLSVFQQAVSGEKQFIGFTEDSNYALLAKKAEDETGAFNQLILIDMKGGGDTPKTTRLSFPRVLHAIVAGNGVFALIAESAGRRIISYDVLSGEPMGEIELDAAAVMGALDEATGESVIVDDSGKVHVLSHGFDTRTVPLEMPEGERAEAISLRSASSHAQPVGPMIRKGSRKAIITRRKDKGLAIYSLRDGKIIREMDAGLANHFIGFIAEGTVFAASGTKSGPNIFTIDGEHVTILTHSRAKDWDPTRMGTIGRQTPILDIGASKDGNTIVTARKDGRVSVWRSGSKPRTGAWGAMPLPELESIAHFDHGQEFGEKVLWRRRPVLSVSPDGRYIASQSPGLVTNPVGGIKTLHPLLRIWDVHQRKEVARFYPKPSMSMMFATGRDLLLSTSPSTFKTNEKGYRLDVWRLSPYPVETERQGPETRSTVPIRDRVASSAIDKHRIAFSANGLRAVWIDDHLKVRVWDKTSDKVETLEILTPIIKSLIGRRAKQLAERGAPFIQAPFDVNAVQKVWIGAAAENPAMMSYALPLKISEDGSRAILAVGTSLRIYDLLSRQMVAERNIEDFYMLNGILLSANGKFFAACGVTWKSYEEVYLKSKTKRQEDPIAHDIQIRVYADDQKAPLNVITLSTRPLNYPVPIQSLTPLAVGPGGRWLVVEKLDWPSKANSKLLPSKDVTIIDVSSGQASRVLFSEQFSPPAAGDFAEFFKTRMAAFSKDGRFVAIRRTVMECPASTLTSPMTLMPVFMPTCQDLKVKYTAWDLRTRRLIMEFEDIEEVEKPGLHNVDPVPPKSDKPPAVVEHKEWNRRKQRRLPGSDREDAGRNGTSPKTTDASTRKKTRETDSRKDSKLKSIHATQEIARAMMLTGINRPAMIGIGRSDRIAFALGDDTSVEVTRVRQDPGSGGMVLITENLSSPKQLYIDEACRRMEPEHKRFDPKQWALQYPGADFHPICAPSVRPQ